MVSVAGNSLRWREIWELVEPLSTEPDIAVSQLLAKADQFKEAAVRLASV